MFVINSSEISKDSEPLSLGLTFSILTFSIISSTAFLYDCLSVTKSSTLNICSGGRGDKLQRLIVSLTSFDLPAPVGLLLL